MLPAGGAIHYLTFNRDQGLQHTADIVADLGIVDPRDDMVQRPPHIRLE